MRKIFFLILALILAMMVNAAVKNITPTTPFDTHDNLRLAIWYAAEQNYDTIVLADGIYDESDDYLYLDKNLVIMAAEGATPVIKMTTYAQIKSGANIKIKGLKFDGSVQGSSYDYYFRFYDDSKTSLVIEDCELYSIKNYVFYGAGSTHTDSLIIKDCFLHNNKKNAVYFPKGTIEGKHPCDKLAVTNTTIANSDALANYTSTIDIHPYNDATSDAVKVIVDHCTFYNNPTINSDYSAIRPLNISDVTISNCIFAHPVAYDRRATSCYGGTISNCLTYNLTYDSGRHAHRQSGGKPALSGNFTGNPLFVDAANNNFRMHNASVARRENGAIWGDPRWETAIQTIAIPARLNAVDAIVSDTAGVISAAVVYAPDSISFKLYPGGDYDYEDKEWAKWKVSVTKAGYYNFTAHVFRADGSQKFEIKLLNSDETSELISNTNTSMSTGEQTISTGKYELTAGNYVVKVRTLYNWAKSRVLFIDATYEGGRTIAIPDTLRAIDALKSERAFVNEAGELRFTDDSHSGYVRDQYGKWKISIAKAGNYKFAVSANSDNAHAYQLILRNSTETSDIASKVQKGSSNTPLKFALDVENLAIGNYVLFIKDTTNYSHGRIEYIAASYEGGAIVNAPGEILATDAKLLKEDGGTLKMTHLANGDIKYDANEDNETEYALWNLHATEAGEMVITVNAPNGGHTLRFELYEGNTLKRSAEEGEDTKWDNNYSLTQHLNIPAAGDYTLKLINKQQYSVCVLHSVTIAPYVAPAGVVMKDTDTDNTRWIADLNNTVDVQMTRTILGGMYNTICLPFKLSSAKCKAIFGNDVELYTLGSATLSGDILNLQFNTASDIWNGTPILIKTSSDIVNPLFENVTIESETADHTNGGFVTFQGTFVQKDFHNGDQVLLLMANNQLAYPQQDRTLKGFRAYFQINGGANSAPIRRANIITPNKVPTEINLVELENNGIIKTIENGQLIIIRDGVRYNAMGVMIE